VLVLSGDVHHAYVAEPSWPAGSGPEARALQLTCSPVHNAASLSMRLGFRFGWTRFARGLGRALAGRGKVPLPSIGWRKVSGPWFGNQLMTLTLRGRGATLRLEQARAGSGDGARLETVEEVPLTAEVPLTGT
jgi:hypothetical protein